MKFVNLSVLERARLTHAASVGIQADLDNLREMFKGINPARSPEELQYIDYALKGAIETMDALRRLTEEE